MRSISTNSRKMQVNKQIVEQILSQPKRKIRKMAVIKFKPILKKVDEQVTTTVKILEELSVIKGLPISIILLNTELSEKDIWNIYKGEQNPEVFAKLLGLACLLDATHDKYSELEAFINEQHTKRIFCNGSQRNECTITNYSDKHGV